MEIHIIDTESLIQNNVFITALKDHGIESFTLTRHSVKVPNLIDIRNAKVVLVLITDVFTQQYFEELCGRVNVIPFYVPFSQIEISQDAHTTLSQSIKGNGWLDFLILQKLLKTILRSSSNG